MTVLNFLRRILGSGNPGLAADEKFKSLFVESAAPGRGPDTVPERGAWDARALEDQGYREGYHYNSPDFLEERLASLREDFCHQLESEWLRLRDRYDSLHREYRLWEGSDTGLARIFRYALEDLKRHLDSLEQKLQQAREGKGPFKLVESHYRAGFHQGWLTRSKRDFPELNGQGSPVPYTALAGSALRDLLKDAEAPGPNGHHAVSSNGLTTKNLQP